MSENDAKKNKHRFKDIEKTSRESNEQQVLTVAAFCFAIVSWMATARGLQAYVFSGGAEATLISFGVQSILFVFNLRLPFLIEKIGELTPKEERKVNRKGKYKYTFAQKIAMGFYALVLITSSFFSFVYIGNELVYKHDTGYADDNTVLMSFYRNQLNEAEKAIDENLRVLPLRASNKLSNLQIKMSKAGLIENSQSVNLEALNAKKSGIIKVVKEKQTAFENAEREYNQAKTDYEDAKATRYWKSDEFEDAKTNLEEKNRVYTAAKNELTQAQNDLMDAEDAVTNYKPSSGSLVMEMLVEFLKPNFNINDMNKHMEDLVDYVLSIGEGEQIPSNYAEIVETVLEINNVLDDYSRLKNADDSESAEEKIKQLKIDVEEKLTIPNPQEDDFENTKTMWVAEWKTRLENLREIVWRIPSYSGEEIAAFSASGIEINKDALEYDSTNISNKIDRLERNKLTDINVMEKVCLLISGKYPLTAIVALLIAIELDMISLLVGVVIYWMSKVSKGTDKEIVLT